MSLYGAEDGTRRKVDQEYLESFEMWCWRTMDKISWTDRVKNEEVLHRAKEERNIIYTIKLRNAYWICHILCRDSVLKFVIEEEIEGRTEVTGRRGKRRKQILDDLKGKRGYWRLEGRAPDFTLWRTRFEESVDLP